MIGLAPCSSSPVFGQDTLPEALRACHDTKPGVRGLLRVLEGELKLTYLDAPSEIVLTADHPGVIEPQQPHFVIPLGAMRMEVDFYHLPPLAG